MTREQWAHLIELFDSLVALPPSERAARVAAACPEDLVVRDELARMLEADARADTFGESPVFEFIPQSRHAASPGRSLEPGARLGRYEVGDLVGAGGMGEVYRARDPELDRDVGLKVLPRRDGMGDDQLARFAREARAAAALNHPNILAVYDVGIDRGIPYVVCELLDGETLRGRLERGPLSFEHARRVALDILAGLAAAHDRGIVHRDLKPDNLFLTSDGAVKILDFGLAKQVATTSEAAEGDGDHAYVMGTAGYMAPEQLRAGGPVDQRADLFAFGAVLAEMLTGTRAFDGASPIETMRAVLTAEPAALSTLPAGLREVVSRCLAKDPAQRFDSAHEVALALGPADTAARAHQPASRAYLYAVAASIMLVAAAAAPVVWRSPDAAPPAGAAGRPAIAVLPFEDRSGDPAIAWLTTGVPGLLVTALAQTPGLDVIGSERLESSFRALGRDPADRSAGTEAARHAGAGAVLVGTLFKAGPDLRLDVQVQDVVTGRVVAARTEQGRDVFAVVDALAGDIRAALDLANRPAGRPLRDVTTTSLEAYALYARAQEARHNNRWIDARTLFQQALRVDPAFTLARAQLVTVFDRLGERDAAEAERRVVRSQLQRLPERQRLLAEAVQEYDTNPPRALELLERLIERYPDEEEAYDAIVHAYTHTGDPAYIHRTLAFMQRWSRAIPGPGSGHFHNHFGYAYIDQRLFTDAEREFRAYIRVSPDEANGYDSLAELFLMTGRPAMAVQYYDEALRRNPLFGWSHFGRAYAFGVQGRYDEAFAALTTLQNLGPGAAVPPAAVHVLGALLHARVGRHAQAADHLAAARRRARELGDAGADADLDLVETLLAVERGEAHRAVQHADRAAARAVDAPVDIIRARRVALAQLLAGIAQARAGSVDAARGRLEELRRRSPGGDPVQHSFQQALDAEIALVEGRLDEAEAAFVAAEYKVATSFAIYPMLVALANNLPSRDGLARAALARGDVPRAIDIYRRLNQPDVTLKWTSLFEPRYARAAAELAARPR